MYLNKLNLQKNTETFKKRYTRILNFREKFFLLKQQRIKTDKNFFVFYRNYINLELKIYKFFIKKLRRMIRRKKYLAFIFVFANHSFSKKAKNSRMGKGKGKSVRFVCRKRLFNPVFAFYKVSFIRIYKFVKFLNKKFYNSFWF